MVSLTEWLDAHSERQLAAQESGVNTAQLVVTFTLAVSGGLLGAAMQMGYAAIAWWNISAFALATLLAVLVFVLDRRVAVDAAAVLELVGEGEDPVARLRTELVGAVVANEKPVAMVKLIGSLQFCVSLVSWCLSVAWLLLRS